MATIHNHNLIAPVKESHGEGSPWAGVVKPPPWAYKVQLAIPTIDASHLNRLSASAWRLQTLRPYMVFIDTGSTPDDYVHLEGLRSDDVEVHRMASHGFRHPSEFISVAMDYALSVCRSPLCLCTHNDCFPVGRNVVEELAGMCDEKTPLVGYRMSPRVHPDYRKMVSHTLTMIHVDTYHRIGASWSIRRAGLHAGCKLYTDLAVGTGWPDTETMVNYCFLDAGYAPKFVGEERNGVRHLDGRIDHFRSYSGSKLYSPAYYAQCDAWREGAVQGMMLRLDAWQKQDVLTRIS